MDERLHISAEVAKAALLLSREHLDDEDIARAAIERLDSPDALIALSVEMFSLPMVANHLSRLAPDWFDPDSTKQIEVQFALMQLTLRAEMHAFVEKCLDPVGNGYAFIKGFALADQFYERPGNRFARDIDVLVRNHLVVDVVEGALKQGYTLLDSVDHTRTLSDRQDIRAAYRYQKVFNLISPKGRHIEVHREVDKEQGIFDDNKLLFESHSVEGGTGSFQTLNPIDHFIYVAYHCARHNWSKLHWLADLAAMERSPLINRDQLLERAAEMGLVGLIDETLAFVKLSSNPDAAPPDAPGARILDRFLEIAQQGERRAVEYANSQTFAALPFTDMLSPSLRRKVHAKRLWSRFKPRMSDYQTWPLPDRWQWLYWLARPTLWALRRGHS